MHKGKVLVVSLVLHVCNCNRKCKLHIPNLFIFYFKFQNDVINYTNDENITIIYQNTI